MRRNLSSTLTRWLPALLLAAVVFAFGCSEDSTGPSGDPPRELPDGVAPEFSLLDVNPNSATIGTEVSPRDQLQRLSAWYFGHAT